MTRTLWIAVASTLAMVFGSSLRADVLFLTNGGRVDGVVLNPDERPRMKYQVQLADGATLTLAKTVVDRFEPKPEAEAKYEVFAAKLPDTVEAHLDAADRCAKANLSEQREHHLQQVVRLNPDHEAARHALGYSRVEGKWQRQDEAMEKKGYQRYGNSWRLPQEVEAEKLAAETEKQRVKWSRDLKMWREWVIKNRDKATLGAQSIRGVRDPAAIPILIEMLKSSKEPRVLRLLYLDVLGELGGNATLELVAKMALIDTDIQVREKCLEKLVKWQSKAATRQFIKALQHDENLVVNRAAVALDRMKDPEATVPLIDALITTHQHVVGSSGMTPSFGSDGSSGLSMGGGQKVVKQKHQNDAVLRTLSALHPGVNFGFDQARWRNWYNDTNKPKPIPSLRRSS